VDAPVSRIRTIGLLLAGSLVNSGVIAAQQEDGEYRAKARFLANAPDFVEWPLSAFQTASAPLLICVHGDFSFGTTLAVQTRGLSVRGYRVEVKWTRGRAGLVAVSSVVRPSLSSQALGKVLQIAKEIGALTIGEV
jgi:uncharacterized protein DUF4154